MNNLNKISIFNVTCILLILLLHFPKIDIVHIASYKQGIRLDDIILLSFFLFYLPKVLFLKGSTGILLIFITLSFFISFINNSNFNLMIIFHYIRFIEYIVLFVVVKHLLSNLHIVKIIKFSLIFQILMVIFQQLIPVSYIERPLSSTVAGIEFIRASGSMAGPWELAIFMGICFFVISDYTVKQKYKSLGFGYFILIWVITILTFARAQLVALLFANISQFKLFSKFLKFTLIFIILTLIILLILYGFELDSFSLGYIQYSTSVNFLSDYGLEFIKSFKSNDFSFLGSGGRSFDLSTETYDPSLVGRLQQWGRYYQTFQYANSYIIGILFGMGPGSGGIINDGMYIKLFVDFGIIGFLIYTFYALKYFLNKNTRALTIFISISCITIDLYWATKITYVLIFASVYFMRLNKSKN